MNKAAIRLKFDVNIQYNRLMASLPKYIYQAPGWPEFSWESAKVAPLLAEIHFKRGLLLASMTSLGFQAQQDSLVQTLVQDVTQSSRIEGENLDEQQVRSSVARRLGIDIAGLPQVSRDVEGVVEMMLDATQNFTQPVTEERLFAWHASLFPAGRSGMQRIEVGQWRTDEMGSMQVVGGPLGRQTVHFEAPPATQVEKEMRDFLKWLEQEPSDPVLKAAITHLWFLTIHPFEDGNGRIARALTDLLLARADRRSERFYSMSAQIEQHRRSYYEVLEQAQRRTSLDITSWLVWFMERLLGALGEAEIAFEKVRLKRCFWDRLGTTELNARQSQMLELLFEDFYGKLKTEKYARLMKCSTATAQRDLADLVQKGALNPDLAAGGRSTNYVLNLEGCRETPDFDLYQPNKR